MSFEYDECPTHPVRDALLDEGASPAFAEKVAKALHEAVTNTGVGGHQIEAVHTPKRVALAQHVVLQGYPKSARLIYHPNEDPSEFFTFYVLGHYKSALGAG